MSAFLDNDRNGDGKSTTRADTIADELLELQELLEYGLFKRLSDRRAARRDARSGLPQYEKEPAPTSTVKELLAKHKTLVATERKLSDQQAAPRRRKLARLEADIKTAEDDLARAEQQFNSTSQATTNGAYGSDMAAQKRRRGRGLEKKRQQLASTQADRKQLDADIASCDKQHLERHDQIVGYTWLRIETYKAELIRVHPHGVRLNAVINWDPPSWPGLFDG